MFKILTLKLNSCLFKTRVFSTILSWWQHCFRLFKMQNNNSNLPDETTASLINGDLKNRQRICLVLDLDQTLLNSCLFSDLTSEEKYLMYSSSSSSCPDDHHHHPTDDTISTSNLLHKLDSLQVMTKLRPFVHSFLKEASEFFEMYIFSMGDRKYSLEMAKLLDPESVYFNSRKVFSYEDCRGNMQKSLDVVFGSREDVAVLILDDREDVWRKEDKENVILVKGYHFFRHSCEQFGQTSKSLHQLRTDESEAEGTLSAILGVLHKIHTIFLDQKKNGSSLSDEERVKLAMKTVRSQVLKGCEIVIISGVSCRIKKMAEQMGAKCSAKVAASVTHVVAVHGGTEESCWAVSEGKFLVHHRWIQAAFYLWQKQPEENYSVD